MANETQNNTTNNNEKEITITLRKWQIDLLRGSLCLHAFLESYGFAMWCDIGGAYGRSDWRAETELNGLVGALDEKAGDEERDYGIYSKPEGLKQILDLKEAQLTTQRRLWEGAAHFRISDNAPETMTFERHLKALEMQPIVEAVIKRMEKNTSAESKQPSTEKSQPAEGVPAASQQDEKKTTTS